jgi:hypothetical protein
MSFVMRPPRYRVSWLAALLIANALLALQVLTEPHLRVLQAVPQRVVPVVASLTGKSVAAWRQVVVLDISDLVPVDPISRQPDPASLPVDDLRSMLRWLADRGVTAIGLDLDIDAAKHASFTTFAATLTRADGTPVPFFSGVGPDGPHVSPTSSIAASRAMLSSTSALPLWTTTEAPAASISARLAKVARDDAPDLPAMLRLLAEPLPIDRASPYSGGVYRVDFQALEPLRQATVPAGGDAALHRTITPFAGKIAILGVVQAPRAQRRAVPGLSAPQPSVLIHAAGVHTLIEAPRYQLSLLGRAVLATALSLAVPAGLWVVRRRNRRRLPPWPMAPVHALVALGVLASAITISLAGLTILDLLWADYAVVAGTLLLQGQATRGLAALVIRR